MLLALDTSGPVCAVALWDCEAGRLVDAQSDSIGRGHAEHLMPSLEELLRRSGLKWHSIDHVACVTGPGSFTGLRVGLSVARGLVLALGANDVGISAFEGFTQHLGTGAKLAIVMDAKRSEIWYQLFDESSVIVSAPRSSGPSDTAGSLNRFAAGERLFLAGSAAPILVPMLENCEVKSDAASPPIEAVAERAAWRVKSGQTSDMNSLSPLYMRSPDAKPQRIGGVQ